jgi:hypothetical protein
MNNYIAIKETTRGFSKEFTDQGFGLTLSNGVYASVKFGFGSYSDEGKTTAEVAIIDKEDNWYIFNGKELVQAEGTDINPRITTDELVEILNLAKQL